MFGHTNQSLNAAPRLLPFLPICCESNEVTDYGRLAHICLTNKNQLWARRVEEPRQFFNFLAQSRNRAFAHVLQCRSRDLPSPQFVIKFSNEAFGVTHIFAARV